VETGRKKGERSRTGRGVSKTKRNPQRTMAQENPEKKRDNQKEKGKNTFIGGVKMRHWKRTQSGRRREKRKRKTNFKRES